MADKGVTIQDLLPLGVTLNIPPFLGQDQQMQSEDVIETQQIASLRIHIERAINKIKNFHISLLPCLHPRQPALPLIHPGRLPFSFHLAFLVLFLSCIRSLPLSLSLSYQSRNGTKLTKTSLRYFGMFDCLHYCAFHVVVVFLSVFPT